MYIDKNSNRYEGQWRNDRAEGYGVKVFAKGDRHEGYYSNDKRNGFGTYYWANGLVCWALKRVLPRIFLFFLRSRG